MIRTGSVRPKNKFQFLVVQGIFRSFVRVLSLAIELPCLPPPGGREKFIGLHGHFLPLSVVKGTVPALRHVESGHALAKKK